MKSSSPNTGPRKHPRCCGTSNLTTSLGTTGHRSWDPEGKFPWAHPDASPLNLLLGAVGDTGVIAITQLLILMMNSPSTFQRSSQKVRLNILNFWTQSQVHLRSSDSLRWVVPEEAGQDRHRQMLRSASLLPEPRVIEQLNGTLLSNALWFFPSHHTQHFTILTTGTKSVPCKGTSHNHNELMALWLLETWGVQCYQQCCPVMEMFRIYTVQYGVTCHLKCVRATEKLKCYFTYFD